MNDSSVVAPSAGLAYWPPEWLEPEGIPTDAPLVELEVPPPGPKILDLVPPPPPSNSLDEHILSPFQLAWKLAYTIEKHRFYATRCPLNCKSMMVSKRTLREKRTQSIEVCAVCMKPNNKEGTLLKFCARCKLVKYCSKKCQQQSWSDHEAMCNRDDGKGMLHLINTVIANPFLMYNILACVAMACKLDQDLPLSERLYLSSKPLFVRMDVGIEPTDITDTTSLYRHREAWPYAGVEGMVQINMIHRAPDVSDPTPAAKSRRRQAYSLWKNLRAQLDKRGMRDVPVAVLEIANNSWHVTTVTVPLFPETIEASKQRPWYRVPVNPIHRDRPNFVDPVENRINHINEHIRYDNKNKFLLRTPMSQRDKDIIMQGFRGLNAGHYSGGMWYIKSLREPVYEPLRVLAEHDLFIEAAKILAEGKREEAAQFLVTALGYRVEFNVQ